MWFSRKQVVGPLAQEAPTQGNNGTPKLPPQPTTKSQGDAAEALACAYLVRAGLAWVQANYRTPGRGGGEIDLIMRAADGTLVFVEVRQRSSASHGGAAASIGAVKQQRIIGAARHYLSRLAHVPPCRFDVVLVHGKGSAATVEWLVAAFDAS